jgi:ribonuclease HII
MRSKPFLRAEQLGLVFDVPGLTAGVDDAGRGPLAGPVVAAAVILDDRARIRGLNDSKLLSAPTRERLFDEIHAKALCFCIAQASVEEIDALNILQATLLAMRRAIGRLPVTPTAVLVDGNILPTNLPCPGRAVVDGDAKSQSIAAASILAKVTRDRLMTRLAQRYPAYGWERNAGYGTPEHQAGIAAAGPCRHHRLGFAPFRNAAE